jgi:DNA topoisomerase-2
LLRWSSSGANRFEEEINRGFAIGKTPTDDAIHSAPDLAVMSDVDKTPLEIPGDSLDQELPSIVDGLNSLQRTILHVHFQRKLAIKITELARRVSVTLENKLDQLEIIHCVDKLARNFVGSNNVNYIDSYGDPGTRRQGGKDAATDQAYTTIIPALTRVMFPVREEYGSKHNWEKSAPPAVYVPALPTILVNGFEVSGCDWSSSIPPHNPDDIVNNLRRRMKGDSKTDMQPMQPWFRDWNGHVEQVDPTRYFFQGKIQKISENVVEITELPPRLWTRDFMKILDREPSVKDYSERTASKGVDFKVRLNEQHPNAATLETLEAKLGLHKIISVRDMVALDEEGRVCRYATTLDLLEEFYHIRSRYYSKEKQDLLQTLRRELQLWKDQSRFVPLLLTGSIDLSQDEDSLLKELQQHNFAPISRDDGPPTKKRKRGTDTALSGYIHLLDMTVLSMTQGPMQELKSLIVKKEAEIAKLEETSIPDLWETDLLAFEQAWRHQKLLYNLDRSFVFSGDDVLHANDTQDREDVGE